MTEEIEITERIRKHLEAITETSGLPVGPESLARITENWQTKRRLFNEQCESLEMILEPGMEPDDPRGMLLLSYSGSLMVLGPRVSTDAPAPNDDGSPARFFEYASISLRQDVPDLITAIGVNLAAPVAVDKPVLLEGGPVERSSELLQIATFEGSVSEADQRERLRQAAIFLTNGFIKANQTTLDDAVKLDHFTLKSMVKYIAGRNDATQTLTRSVIDDFLMMIESGMLLGERVSLGSLGKASLGVRAAQKARMGRNPATGEELLISAKPETAVPKFSFSSRVKERASRVPVERVKEE
jgi:nucleoid DNA-binding protein